MILDWDSKFDGDVTAFLKATGLETKRTASRAPWQNGIAERWAGSCRREIIDHILALNEQRLRRLIRDYVNCYHQAAFTIPWERTRQIGVWPSTSRLRPRK
jgi:putative transposase